MSNCLVVGVGGQGILFASKLIATAARNAGFRTITSETIGMSQRGGSVASHIRIGEHAFSPLIPSHKADLIIAFEPAEALRALSYSHAETVIVSATSGMQPVSAALKGVVYKPEAALEALEANQKHVFRIDDQSLLSEIGNERMLNVTLVGAALATGSLEIGISEAREALSSISPARFRELNNHALDVGFGRISQ